MIRAQSVSAHLRRLGYNGMRSDYRRQGIHVRNGYNMVSVSVDYDSDSRAARTAADIAAALNESGYRAVVNPDAANMVDVTKPASS